MGVSGALQTYKNVIDYGMRKVHLRFDRLLLQAFMAGVFIGMAGNACLTFAGGFPTDPADPRSIPPVMQKFIFASIFPVAFVAIITTGAELFTGNTMTMLVCWFERRVTLLQLLRNWSGSFIGNWLGTLFSAYFLTYLCCNFDKSPYFEYLNAIAEHKTSHGWGSCFLRGVGCNTWVCLAVWFVLACDDWSGKILALWFPIVCFVLSSYEHIIANLYTLQLCAMFGVRTPLSSIIVSNLLPTFLGNVLGGCFLVGAVYFYNFYSSVQEEKGGGGGGRGSPFHLAGTDSSSSRREKDQALLTCLEGGVGKGGGFDVSGRDTPRERSEFFFKDGIPSLQLPMSGAGGGGGFCPAGAATAAECSENSSNKGLKISKGRGTAAAGGGGGGNEKNDDIARRGNDGGEQPQQRQGHLSYLTVAAGGGSNGKVGKGGVALDSMEKGGGAAGGGGGPAVGGAYASAETWTGEVSTKGNGTYSNNSIEVSSSSTVMKAAATHAAAGIDIATDTQASMEELWRGGALRVGVPLPPAREGSGLGTELVCNVAAGACKKNSPAGLHNATSRMTSATSGVAEV